MNEQEILEKLQSLTQAVLGREDIMLTEKTAFTDLGVGSFGMIQLICAIEDEFEIEIPNLAVKTINSVPAAVKLIKQLIQAK